MLSERNIQREIIKTINQKEDVRVFSNDTGMAYRPKTNELSQYFIDKHFIPIKYGLVPGSSDLIGFKTVRITPEMVGKEVAVFVSLEVKTPKRRLIVPDPQIIWLNNVKNYGGIAEVVTSIEEAEIAIETFRPVQE